MPARIKSGAEFAAQRSGRLRAPNPLGLPDGWEKLRGLLDPFLDFVFDDLLRSPFALLSASLWLYFVVLLERPLLALVVAPLASVAFLALEALYRASAGESFESRWGFSAFISAVAVAGAIALALFRALL
ncbi:MAG: hypothetical protein ACRD5K_00355 [Candidatus Acidiferrales bacterium]